MAPARRLHHNNSGPWLWAWAIRLAAAARCRENDFSLTVLLHLALSYATTVGVSRCSRATRYRTAASMAEVLQVWADQTPDALAFCFLIDGEEEGPRLTYAELDSAARAVAVTLLDVATPGDRALLLYCAGLEFITAFFGCQYAGIVPVPAYPPRFDRPALGWQTLAGIAADCQPRVILTGGPVAPFIASGARSSARRRCRQCHCHR